MKITERKDETTGVNLPSLEVNTWFVNHHGSLGYKMSNGNRFYPSSGGEVVSSPSPTEEVEAVDLVEIIYRKRRRR